MPNAPFGRNSAAQQFKSQTSHCSHSQVHRCIRELINLIYFFAISLLRPHTRHTLTNHKIHFDRIFFVDKLDKTSFTKHHIWFDAEFFATELHLYHFRSPSSSPWSTVVDAARESTREGKQKRIPFKNEFNNILSHLAFTISIVLSVGRCLRSFCQTQFHFIHVWLPYAFSRKRFRCAFNGLRILHRMCLFVLGLFCGLDASVSQTRV